eukprot:jgi/Chlat1/1011/Chrsp109S01451
MDQDEELLKGGGDGVDDFDVVVWEGGVLGSPSVERELRTDPILAALALEDPELHRELFGSPLSQTRPEAAEASTSSNANNFISPSSGYSILPGVLDARSSVKQACGSPHASHVLSTAAASAAVQLRENSTSPLRFAAPTTDRASDHKPDQAAKEHTVEKLATLVRSLQAQLLTQTSLVHKQLTSIEDLQQRLAQQPESKPGPQCRCLADDVARLRHRSGRHTAASSQDSIDRLGQLQLQAQESKHRNARLQEANSSLLCKVRELSSQHAVSQGELTRLQEKEAAASRACKRYRLQLSQVNNEAQQLAAKLDTTMRELAQAQSRLEKASATVNWQRVEIKRLQAQATHLQALSLENELFRSANADLSARQRQVADEMRAQ